MKIKKTRKKRLVCVADINPGECFEHSGRYYMRLRCSSILAVRLDDGTEVMFENRDFVMPVVAEMLVYTEDSDD